MRRAPIGLGWIAVLGLACNASASVAEAPGVAPGERLTVVLLPARVHVLRLGFEAKSSEEWTAAAGATVNSALREAVDQSTHFSGREMPSITPGDFAAIDEFLAVATLVQLQADGESGHGVAKALRANIDRTIGPSLSFLSERAGADYALGVVGFQVEQSKGLVAATSVGVVASVLFPPLLVLPSVTSSYAALFLIDLRTGEVRWFNRRSGYEVGGFNFTDLRDPKSAREVMDDLLKPYPEITSLRGTKGATAVAAGMSVHPTSPKQGEFEFHTPEGWRVKQGERTNLTATRDGRLLNQIAVELRDHGQAFPESGQESSRNSSPSQLAEWYIAELHSQEHDDLQISETSHDGQLAGHAAFRVRFSYRLPIDLGGARFEQVTIGAAVPHGLLLAQLSAPQLNYLEKALPSFEESTATIVLKRRNHLQ